MAVGGREKGRAGLVFGLGRGPYSSFFFLALGQRLAGHHGWPLRRFSAWVSWKSLSEPNSGSRRSATGFFGLFLQALAGLLRGLFACGVLDLLALAAGQVFSRSASRMRSDA